jgi:hypothetical protein
MGAWVQFMGSGTIDAREPSEQDPLNLLHPVNPLNHP